MNFFSFSKISDVFRKKYSYRRAGGMLLLILIAGGVVAVSIIGGLVSYAVIEHKVSVRQSNRDLAFHIAEAGINYYRWHLAHSPNDYYDGNPPGTTGPFVHPYYDKDGNQIGSFSLEIDEPLTGSSIVTVRSTGSTQNGPLAVRTVQARVGFPSLTNNSFLTNAGLTFSNTTVVHGIVQSNGPIRFDGTTDSYVRSAIATTTYNGADVGGVYGAGGPQSFWQYPVPPIDFYSVTADLSQIRDAAMAEGVHILSSGDDGWHIRFFGDNFNLYRVNSLRGYPLQNLVYRYDDIHTETFVANYPIPDNGMIFVEDTVWVDGTVDGRVSVGVGRFPVAAPYLKVVIPSDITLSGGPTGDDVIGIMTQGDIIVPRNAPNNMTIEAALLSQFGLIYRPAYLNHTRNSLTIFGSQISYNGGGWKYISNGSVYSGFVNTYHSYNANLRFYPPPGFPFSSIYELVSWEELE